MSWSFHNNKHVTVVFLSRFELTSRESASTPRVLCRSAWQLTWFWWGIPRTVTLRWWKSCLSRSRTCRSRPLWPPTSTISFPPLIQRPKSKIGAPFNYQNNLCCISWKYCADLTTYLFIFSWFVFTFYYYPRLGQKIKDALQDPDVSVATHSDYTKKSRNYNLGMAHESMQAAIQGNIIFDPSSQLPREIMLETTLKAFGFNMDLWEVCSTKVYIL